VDARNTFIDIELCYIQHIHNLFTNLGEFSPWHICHPKRGG